MKIIKGFLITIIVAMLCVFVAFFIWWMDPLFDTSGKKLTYEELRKLAESFQDISNVYVKNGTSDSEYFEYYKKDDTIMQHKYQSGELEAYELLNEINIAEELSELIRKRYNLIVYNDENIVATKTSILASILKASDNQVDYETIMLNIIRLLMKMNWN